MGLDYADDCDENLASSQTSSSSESESSHARRADCDEEWPSDSSDSYSILIMSTMGDYIQAALMLKYNKACGGLRREREMCTGLGLPLTGWCVGSGDKGSFLTEPHSHMGKGYWLWLCKCETQQSVVLFVSCVSITAQYWTVCTREIHTKFAVSAVKCMRNSGTKFCMCVIRNSRQGQTLADEGARQNYTTALVTRSVTVTALRNSKEPTA